MDGVSCEDMMDHPSYTHDLNSCEIKPEKIQAWTEFEPEPMTCDTGSELYQLSYQANWELVILWIRNIPLDVEKFNEYMKDHINWNDGWRLETEKMKTFRLYVHRKR